MQQDENDIIDDIQLSQLKKDANNNSNDQNAKINRSIFYYTFPY